MRKTHWGTKSSPARAFLRVALAVVLPCCLPFGSAWSQSHPGQGTETTGPIVHLPVLTHDFGVIKSTVPTYQHDFLVYNVGSEVLILKEVVVG